jgi:hypothetical protein
MSPRVDLKLDWCSYTAAKYACDHWHYAKAIPRTRLLKIGVWEHKVFVGCVIFNRSANNHLGQPYGLTQFQCCELVRVAMHAHETAISRIVRIALSMLKGHSPGMRLVVSFADPAHGHCGGIYQAGNWIYTGMTIPAVEHIVGGRQMHGRAVRATYGTSRGFPKVMGSAKHRYLMPLDTEIRKRIEFLAKPYPKRAASIVPDAPSDQGGEGSWQETAALQELG